jgi:hypothetical protein
VVKPQLGETTSAVDTFSPLQLRRLLVLAAGGDIEEPEIDADDISTLLVAPCRRRGESAQVLIDAVVAPGTPVVELGRIKDLAKRMLDDAADATEREAARLLYHLAVASALGHHGEDISTRPKLERRLLYERLALTFAGHAASQVFRQAADRLASI